jgi:hypothetical protein
MISFAAPPHFTKHALNQVVHRFKETLPREAITNMERGDYKMLRNHMMTLFGRATRQASVTNDTAFMTYLHEQYGYDTRFAFFNVDQMVLVGVEKHFEDQINITIVTVIDMRKAVKAYSARHMQPRKKFSKIFMV